MRLAEFTLFADLSFLNKLSNAAKIEHHATTPTIS